MRLDAEQDHDQGFSHPNIALSLGTGPYMPYASGGFMPVPERPISQDGVNAYLNDPYSGVHYEHVHKDITRRLRLICSGLSVAEFSLLIDRMTCEQIRGEYAKF
jgi:hypothetical protein